MQSSPGAHVIEPIGVFHGEHKYPYEAPRQGVYAPEGDEGRGQVRLRKGYNFEQALRDLDGFDRIWLVFGFHLNANSDANANSNANAGSNSDAGPRRKDWKPLVRPPRHTKRKIGVFATRAPHRPNGLGLSAVRLISIQGLTLEVSGADLLDGSPIYDLKPYLPAYDSFPDATSGWTAAGASASEAESIHFKIEFEPAARERIDFLKSAGGPDLVAFIQLQLEHDPTDTRRKRVAAESRKSGDSAVFILAYRTWRIRFQALDSEQAVRVLSVASGYSTAERESDADPYGDVELHRAFVRRFP